ncbi:hypothetical protein COTS27_01143 [Spirochaetota bacterium]|nr:hypothetical protein COTS27_01143 [Spirochaetota bacterium]
MKAKLIIITIDGVRSDALVAARTPVLDEIKSQASYSMNGQTIYPCATLPAHTSLFYGIKAEQHGVLTNESYPTIRNFTTLFDEAWLADYKTGAYVSWFQLTNTYGDREKLNYVHFNRFYKRREGRLIGDFYDPYESYMRGLCGFLRQHDIDLLHFYMEAPDVWGHFNGWMSKEYLHAIEVSDRLLGRTIDEIRAIPTFAETTFLITTDHGGLDKEHVEDTPESRTIWFMAMGTGIKQNYALKEFSILDLAPTCARRLALPINPQWQGTVLDIFTQ